MLALLLLAAALPAQTVASVVERARRGGITAGVRAVDVDSGETVYGFQDELSLIPASNQKLLTAAAFLSALGEDYRFTTRMRVVDGVLEVVAGGDPNWSVDGDYAPSRLWARVALELRDKGVSRLRGLRLLPGAFTGPARPAGWEQRDHWKWYGAKTGGHVLERGLWLIELSDAGGQDASVRLIAPEDALELRGRILLTKDKQKGGSYFASSKGLDLNIKGHFLRGANPRVEKGPIDDPTVAYQACAERQLSRAGIRFDPQAPGLNVELRPIETPLYPALERCLRDSSNFDAEQLLRVLGAELGEDGSFDGGRAAVAAELRRLCGAVPPGTRIDDGSGLSRGNRLSASFIAELLVTAANQPWAQSYVGALATPGDEGTLRKRFKESDLGPRVRAKTGTLTGASSLSGYLRRSDGGLLAFSILMNWSKRGKGISPRALQEEIVEALR